MLNNYKTHNGYLTGTLLLSSPESCDIFKKSCILICAHDDNGAMGLILNKFETEITLNELLLQMDIPSVHLTNNPRIHSGGPVNMEQGFILHDTTYSESDTANINQYFNLTTTVNILGKIAQNQGPVDYKIALGYTGWAKGQLESEIKNNMWISLPATRENVFSDFSDTMWYSVLNENGINPTKIHSHHGLA